MDRCRSREHPTPSVGSSRDGRPTRVYHCGPERSGVASDSPPQDRRRERPVPHSPVPHPRTARSPPRRRRLRRRRGVRLGHPLPGPRRRGGGPLRPDSTADGGLVVRFETPDRWLSESVEADLYHSSDSRGAARGVPRRTRVADRPILSHGSGTTGTTTFDVFENRASGRDEFEDALTWILAYEATFHELGDVAGEEETDRSIPTESHATSRPHAGWEFPLHHRRAGDGVLRTRQGDGSGGDAVSFVLPKSVPSSTVVGADRVTLMSPASELGDPLPQSRPRRTPQPPPAGMRGGGFGGGSGRFVAVERGDRQGDRRSHQTRLRERRIRRSTHAGRVQLREPAPPESPDLAAARGTIPRPAAARGPASLRGLDEIEAETDIAALESRSQSFRPRPRR